MRSASTIILSETERSDLDRLVRRHGTGQALARRARLVLFAAEGLQSKEIAVKLGVSQSTVGMWRRRYAHERLDGLYDEPRPGTPRSISDDENAETIRLTLETTPKNATHWSLRSMATAVGHPERLTGALRTGLRPQSNRSALETLKVMWKVREITCRNRRSNGRNKAHEQVCFRMLTCGTSVTIVEVCAQTISEGVGGGSCRTRTYNQTVMSGRL
jgi:transposase